jgi:hypothetical protein
MTTKSLKFPYGFTLELLAVSNALHAENPNSRSPAFAIQAVYKPLMASPNSPTRGHPKLPQAAHSDYDPSAWIAKRAAASLSL